MIYHSLPWDVWWYNTLPCFFPAWSILKCFSTTILSFTSHKRDICSRKQDLRKRLWEWRLQLRFRDTVRGSLIVMIAIGVTGLRCFFEARSFESTGFSRQRPFWMRTGSLLSRRHRQGLNSERHWATWKKPKDLTNPDAFDRISHKKKQPV